MTVNENNDPSWYLHLSKQKDQRLMEKANRAFRMVSLNLPFLAPLVYEAEIRLETRIPTAAVTPSGRVILNPEFLESLTLKEATFVLAHEIYHLVLLTHQRASGADRTLVNIAHDLIINDILESELRMVPPAGGLRCPGAKEMSLERLLVQLRQKQLESKLPTCFWRRGSQEIEQSCDLQRAIEQAITGKMKPTALAGGLESKTRENFKDDGSDDGRENAIQTLDNDAFSPGHDALNTQEELALFPQETADGVTERSTWLLNVAIQSVAFHELQHAWDHDALPNESPNRSDRVTTEIEVLRDAYRTPWEQVIQQWLDANLPQPRSYARPSRRAGNRTDVVLPGRNRDEVIVHVILDTSGSMYSVLGQALGALSTFCEASGINQVRLVQADAGIVKDEVVYVDELHRLKVTGFCGWEGYQVRRRLQPPPPPKTEPAKKPKTPHQPWTPQPTSAAEQVPVRRRNRVVSKRRARLNVPVHHQKRRRRRIRRGDTVKIRLVDTPDPTKSQLISLPAQETPLLGMQTRPDSNLAPAMRYLAEQSDVHAVLILTDGEVEYAAEQMPYELLWVQLPDEGNGWVDFQPEIGNVVRLELPGTQGDIGL